MAHFRLIWLLLYLIFQENWKSTKIDSTLRFNEILFSWKFHETLWIFSIKPVNNKKLAQEKNVGLPWKMPIRRPRNSFSILLVVEQLGILEITTKLIRHAVGVSGRINKCIKVRFQIDLATDDLVILFYLTTSSNPNTSNKV